MPQSNDSTPTTADVVSLCESDSVLRSYLRDLTTAVQQIDRVQLREFAALVCGALRDGRSVFIVGNGGSASSSSHMASDLMWATRTFEPRPRIVALSDNIARLTALSNDVSYEESFALQLGTGGARDVLIILSVSGSSPNLVAAAREARRRGMTVVAALGRRGMCAGHADHTLVLGDGDYGLTEDLHLSLNHMIVRLLEGAPQTVHLRTSTK